MGATSHDPTASADRHEQRQKVVGWVLVVRALVVLSLGVAFLIAGDDRPLLGNLLASYWLAGALVTLAWVRVHRDHPSSRLALTAGIVAALAGVLGLTRSLLEQVVSPDELLAIFGLTAVFVGVLRLLGAFSHDAERPSAVRRYALGLSEVAIGVVWIAVDEVSRPVTTAVGLWALVGGTIMLVDALAMRRARPTAPPSNG